MNIWDSVHRGLEKASHEAARIAKTQRLRSTIDQLSRQVYTQHDALIGRVMDLYNNHQLTQSELIPICQELMSLHHQLTQAQNEMAVLQSAAPTPQQAALPPAPATPGQTPIPPGPITAPPPPAIQDAETVIAPPPPNYQFYMDPTIMATQPPPPPGIEPPTMGSAATMAMEQPVPTLAPRLCFVCHAELLPGQAFCNNCGTPIGDISSSYLPTSRGTLPPDEQETARASITAPPPPSGGEYGTIMANEPQQPATNPTPPADDDATIRASDPARQHPDGGL